jgi:hypothetical protein
VVKKKCSFLFFCYYIFFITAYKQPWAVAFGLGRWDLVLESGCLIALSIFELDMFGDMVRYGC